MMRFALKAKIILCPCLFPGPPSLVEDLMFGILYFPVHYYTMPM